MKIYSTNGYCKDVALLCTGHGCLFDESKIYCGYDQTANYCQFPAIGLPSTGKFECNNVGSGSCNNNYTEATCDNMIAENPITLTITSGATCNELQTMELTDAPITASVPSIPNAPTTAPSVVPTFLLTDSPSVSPTNQFIIQTTPITSSIQPTIDPTMTRSPTTIAPENSITIPPTNDILGVSVSSTHTTEDPTTLTNASFPSPTNPSLIQGISTTSSIEPSDDTRISASVSVINDAINPSVSPTLDPSTVFMTTIDETMEGHKEIDENAQADSIMTEYLVIIISSLLVLCVCILIFAHYTWKTRRKPVISDVKQIYVVENNDNVQNDNVQHNFECVSRESKESMYMDSYEEAIDYVQSTTKLDEKRKEGQPTVMYDDETDIGYV